jgi:hypothetical protein
MTTKGSSKGKRGKTMTPSRTKASKNYSKKHPMMNFRMDLEMAGNVETLRKFFTTKYRNEGHMSSEEVVSKADVGRLSVNFLYEYLLIQKKKRDGGMGEGRIPIEGQHTFIEKGDEELSPEALAEKQEILARAKEDGNGKTKRLMEVSEDPFMDSDWDPDRLVNTEGKK